VFVSSSGSISYTNIFTAFPGQSKPWRLSMLYGATGNLPTTGEFRISRLRGETAPRPAFTLAATPGTGGIAIDNAGSITGATGGTLTYDYLSRLVGSANIHKGLSFAASGLPSGISLNPTTGVLTVSSSARGNATPIITVTNNWAKSVNIPISISITQPTVSSASTSTRTAKTVLITWSGSYTNVIVTWTPGSGSSGTLTGTSYTASGLSANTLYTFTITPYNSNNAIGDSTTLSNVYTMATITSVSASTSSTNTISVTWSGTYSYVIVAWNGGASSSGTQSGSSFNVTGLNANTSYTFTVTPYNANNEVGTSSNLTRATLPIITSATFGTATTTTVPVNWSGNYTYVRVTWTPGTTSANQGGASFIATGLTSGTSYSFSVTPYNSDNAAGSTFNIGSITTLVAIPAATSSQTTYTLLGKSYPRPYNKHVNACTLFTLGGSLVLIGQSSYIGSVTTPTIQMNGILSGKTIIATSIGDEFAIVVDSNGIVYGWGSNYGKVIDGRSGSPNTIPLSSPVNISEWSALSGKVITTVAAGWNFVLALDNQGKMYSWGMGSSYQLANGTNTTYETPVLPGNFQTGSLNAKTIVAVGAGQVFAVALDSNGQVHSWGSSLYGALGIGGDPTSGQSQTQPTMISLLSNAINGKTIVSIAVGNEHVIALDSQGNIYGWGRNHRLQVSSDATSYFSSPLRINDAGSSQVNGNGNMTNQTFVYISAGGMHSGAINSSGSLFMWGDNQYGQIGIGQYLNDRYGPGQIINRGSLTGKKFTAVITPAITTFAIDTTNGVHGWGFNSLAQVGNGTNTGTIWDPISITFPTA